MREDDGRKLDHHTLEVLRLRAVDQVARGVPAAEVGAGLTAVGIHPKTIDTWLAKARAGGRQALLSRSAPGPRRKLSDTQLRELADLIITTDPRDHGFPVALWTREIVRQLIAARFGVPLTVASVGRTLHGLGFSAQRPLYRAEQADPAAVARWTQVEYPRIAAQAKAAGGTVFFIDEAGVRSDYHAGTTWAPVAQTPAVRTTGARFAPVPDLGDQRAGRAAVLGAARHADRRPVHRLPPAADLRRPARRYRTGVLHRRQPPGAPREDRRPLRRLHPRRAAAAPTAGVLPTAQPGRMGVEERQARRGGPRGSQRPGPDEGGHHRPPAPTAAPTADRPRLLRRPGVGIHRCCRLKSTSAQSHWVKT